MTANAEATGAREALSVREAVARLADMFRFTLPADHWNSCESQYKGGSCDCPNGDNVRALIGIAKAMRAPTQPPAASPGASGTPPSAAPEECDCGHPRGCHNALAESVGRRSCSLCPCMAYGAGRPSQHSASPEADGRVWFLNVYGDEGYAYENEAVADAEAERENYMFARHEVVSSASLDVMRAERDEAKRSADCWLQLYGDALKEVSTLRVQLSEETPSPDATRLMLAARGDIETMQALRGELARVQWLADERQRQLADEARVIETWRQENATLRAQLTEVQRERDEWEGHYHAAEKHNEILRDSVEGHGETIRTLRAARDAALARVQREWDEAVRRAEDEANARIREAERTIATLRAERDAALDRARVAELEQEREDVRRVEDSDTLYAMISAYEDCTGERLPDGDGEDYRIVAAMLRAALGRMLKGVADAPLSSSQQAQNTEGENG